MYLERKFAISGKFSEILEFSFRFFFVKFWEFLENFQNFFNILRF